MRAKTGTCPHCGRSLELRGDGRVPTHDHPPPCRAVCPGSGQKPLPRPRPLSAAQRAWLNALAAGWSPTARFTSRSEYGGATGTAMSLRRRGLVDDAGDLTAAGRRLVGGNKETA